MPRTSGSLFEGKPLIEVVVADAVPVPREVSARGEDVAFSVNHYRALLDTGADVTCLCDHVVRECQLRQYGIIQMTSGGGTAPHRSYIIHLGILCQEPNDFEGQAETTTTLFQLPDPFEAAAIRDNRWFDIIIGTDIICEHDLRLTKGGNFVFTLGQS
jgi:hypothetical protein